MTREERIAALRATGEANRKYYAERLVRGYDEDDHLEVCEILEEDGDLYVEANQEILARHPELEEK